MDLSPAGNPQRFAVIEPSGAGEVRRHAVAIAQQLGFDETSRGRVAIVASELANNLARHAKEGELLVRAADGDGTARLELLALDRGPGMADVGRSLVDGVTRGTTPGTGLGAVRRQSDRFDIHSLPGAGTAVVAQLWAGAAAPRLDAGVVCLPQEAHEAPGDGWALWSGPDRAVAVVVDGLGHGPLAAEAARAALEEFQAGPQRSPVELLEAAHAALRATRGAAVAVAELDLARRVARFAGVGNVAATVIAPSASGLDGRGLVSLNGTVGHSVRKVQAFEYPWPRGALLVMHSDGLAGQWRLERYPGLAQRHPSLIAGVLWRDFARGRDDATVLAVREAAGKTA